jgi:hypothetical protein
VVGLPINARLRHFWPRDFGLPWIKRYPGFRDCHAASIVALVIEQPKIQVLVHPINHAGDRVSSR